MMSPSIKTPAHNYANSYVHRKNFDEYLSRTQVDEAYHIPQVTPANVTINVDRTPKNYSSRKITFIMLIPMSIVVSLIVFGIIKAAMNSYKKENT